MVHLLQLIILLLLAVAVVVVLLQTHLAQVAVVLAVLERLQALRFRLVAL